jgi:hypothetical protein
MSTNLNGPAQKTPRPFPIRHLSLKLGDSTPYKWARILQGSEFVTVPATQCSIDQMENSRLMYLLLVLRAIRNFIGGQKIINKWVNISSGFSHIFRDLNPVYRMDRLNDGEGGTWTTDPSGKHYSIENYAMLSIQKLCLNRDNFSLVVQLPQDIRDFLNIKISGSQVVIGADFTLPAIPSTYDKTIMQRAPITCDHPMKKLSSDQLSKLSDATNSHHNQTGGTQEFLRILEESAVDEEQRHFFSMLQFNGGHDPFWSESDLALIEKLEDLTWNRWDEELRKNAPNWGFSHYWEIAHQQAHAMAAFNTISNLQNVQMLYRLPCLDQSGEAIHIGMCPEENQGQVISRLRSGIFFQGQEATE